MRAGLGRHGDHGDWRLGGIDVQPLSASDWPQLRLARLRALQESPDAFISEYERESGWSKREWLAMFESALWVVARSRGRIVGLAAIIERGGSAVATTCRVGLGRTALPPARYHPPADRGTDRDVRVDPGVSELVIWVLQGNDRARRVYQRLGFRPTGERQVLSDGAGPVEERLILRIDGE